MNDSQLKVIEAGVKVVREGVWWRLKGT